MALFGLIRRKSAVIPSFYPGIDIAGGLRSVTGTRIDCKTISGQLNAYVNCPPVATVITTKATAANNAQWWFGKADGSQTLNDTTAAYKRLFNKPNQYQDWKRFFALAYMMQQLFGKAYIYVNVPDSMPSRYATSMLVIPNHCITPEYNRDGTLTVKRYHITLAGKTFYTDAENIMVWSDFTFDIQNPFGYIEGQSRLYSLSDPVNTLIAVFEANNTIITNYGMVGIVSPAAGTAQINGFVNPMKDDQKKQVQDDLQRRYGLMRGQWPFLITGQPIEYTAVGRPTKDLMLFETIQDSTRIIADAYKLPIYLLGFTQGTTFNNYQEANKGLYNDAIIPEVGSFVDCFNQYFGNTSDNMLRYSFDHLPALQANRLENEQALKTAAERLKIEVEAGLTNLPDAQKELNELKD